MTEHLKNFDKVYVDVSSQNSETAKRAYKIFPKHKIQIVQEDFFKKGRLSAEQFGEVKKICF